MSPHIPHWNSIIYLTWKQLKAVGELYHSSVTEAPFCLGALNHLYPHNCESVLLSCPATYWSPGALETESISFLRCHIFERKLSVLWPSSVLLPLSPSSQLNTHMHTHRAVYHPQSLQRWRKITKRTKRKEPCWEQHRTFPVWGELSLSYISCAEWRENRRWNVSSMNFSYAITNEFTWRRIEEW